MFSALRRYLIAGLLVWLPLGATVLVIKLLVGFMDRILLLLPETYQPEAYLGFSVPGLGLLFAAAVVVITGAAVANLFGRKVVSIWEAVFARIPLVRSVYGGAKQLAETLFSSTGQSFRKVVLVEFPRKDVWTVAFLTGTAVGEAQRRTTREVVNLYVPTTPNPTGGYFIMVPREDIVELDMSVDEGLKMLISMGAVVPPERRESFTEKEAEVIL
ncbi:DUF502 domain-containing protein [Thiohalomonas denitrificans]|uniref:Uncharacterized membrane protein n=1 Tax=Thiohalomonas denitrificans TaxID=415747 RepID=A0A1G5PKW2_9GAMM|nr:DUF502 domain-containing protein [Thiohalomonas denitrificans]SCZ50164.1 Uncharacterized membrane protein [Thiohalomonas denitrificans]